MNAKLIQSSGLKLIITKANSQACVLFLEWLADNNYSQCVERIVNKPETIEVRMTLALGDILNCVQYINSNSSNN